MDGSRLSALARGMALFLGLFTLLNLLAELRAGFDANLWWIDLRPAPTAIAHGILFAAAATLLHFAVRRRMSRAGRLLTVGVCVILLLATLANAAQFYQLARAGVLVRYFPVPLSLWLAGGIALILLAAWRSRPALHRRRGIIYFAASFLACAVLFPLGQMICFGHSDYRRPADVIVVFGALVYPDGRPSDALRDRVEIACELYHHGLARRIIFSGGPGEDGTHETAAMRKLAMELGVADADILLDPDGLSTADTARNTVDLFRQHDFARVLAVSHFYHLPRIKMTYQRYGQEVWTVPVRRPLRGTPKFVIREVAALWVYYLRMVWA